jgi:hypothetical protein
MCVPHQQRTTVEIELSREAGVAAVDFGKRAWCATCVRDALGMRGQRRSDFNKQECHVTRQR